MLKRYYVSTTLISLGLCASTMAMADGANIHVSGGVSLAKAGGTKNVNLGAVTDQFNTNGGTQTQAVWGYGVGYQWDAPIQTTPLAINLGVTGYYTSNFFKGVQTPAVNLIANADTLNYGFNETSWAWMVEPKLISTAYIWQPYFMFGLGVSTNKLTNYSEMPSNPNSSAVAVNKFANKSTTNFAWEVGVGVQRNIYTTPAGKKLVLSGEYRYMNWGPMSLGTTPAQTTNQGPTFNNLTTNLFDIGLSLQF